MAGAGPQFSSGLPCHRCHCLCVNVERDLAAGVTQRLLFRLNAFIVRLQQRCVTVPECVPPNALANERQPPITLQRILPMEIDDCFFRPQLPPEIAGNPTVVFVDTTVALSPVIDLLPVTPGVLQSRSEDGDRTASVSRRLLLLIGFVD